MTRPPSRQTGEATSEELLAGAAHRDGRNDLAWALGAPEGNESIRTLGFVLRKAMRRCAEAVTFDRGSFERALAEVPPGALPVLAPSHRSYFDFLLLSYLCFQHPELGLAVPHIAAAEEFGRIPVVGRILQRAQAFYLRRGTGQRSPELDAQLQRIASAGGSLMFFIEGQRSRSRHTLAPKRGLLRGLQSTGRSFVVLPVGLSYERLPEERSFERELTGGRRSRMYLAAIVRWARRLSRGEEQMGRIHITCGAPLPLTSGTDVPTLSQHIVAELQRRTAVTRMHLRSFVAETRLPGVDEDWLAAALTRRGATVLDAGLPTPVDPSPVLRQTLRNQWMPWLYPAARALHGGNLAVLDHIRQRGWFTAVEPEDEAPDARLARVVEALFAPVIADYVRVARSLGEPGSPLVSAGPVALVRAQPDAHLPHLEDAFRSLVAHGILVETSPGEHAWGPDAAKLATWRAGCGDLPHPLPDAAGRGV